MQVWIKECKEPGEIRDRHGKTNVLYVSKLEIQMTAKSRPQVVKNLLENGCGVFGACLPKNSEVLAAVRHLQGQNLDSSVLDLLLREHNRNASAFSFAFCKSRNFFAIMRWLNYELTRGSELRKDKLSWKQKQRRVGHWYP